MSVIGFDIGNFKSSVGLARQGGIEIVANEYSDRITPTYVSFTNKERFQGHASRQQEITNNQNTISCFKRFLGRKVSDSQVQYERTLQPYRITSAHDEHVLFNVDYLNEVKSFTTEQIMAMFLTKLKTIGEMNLNAKMSDCVISVPVYMTDAERRALLDSAQIAGLNCLKLMNDTTAIALSYGLYNNTLPEVTERSHTVVFVDMGFTHVQASAVAFNKGKLRMIATTFDNNLGGRDFDRVIMDYFQQDFKERYKVDAYSNARARLRLRAECEKLKKLMSSNNSSLPLNIECFMNDIDVSGRLKREDFEKMSEKLLQRIRKCLTELLKEAKLKPENIDLVEIVGGSTRIPAVKQIIQEVLGKEPSTTLNADEACARGCTLMCAILSPTFKVKEFKIEDCQLFPITLNWKGAEKEDNELEVFTQFDKIPMSKLLTIYKREPFEIEARYRFPNNIPFSESRIGRFQIDNVAPNMSTGENSEIKIKARITKSGVFEISQPQLIEIVSGGDSAASNVSSNVSEDSNMQPDKPANGGADATAPQSNGGAANQEVTPDAENGPETMSMGGDEPQQTTPNAAPADAADGAQQPGTVPAAKKKKTKATDLPMTVKVPQLTKTEINSLIEQELSMIQQDRKEKERSEAKNSVEEYIYDAREKLSNEYEKFITEDHKSKFLKLLDDTESWLYSEEAEDQEKSVYVDRLQKLKDFGEPARKRYRESQERPHAFEELGRSLQLIKKALNSYFAMEEKYNHLDKADIDKVVKCCEEKERWFNEKHNMAMAQKPYEDPIVLVSQIKHEKESLDKTSWSVLNRPKPKVEPPKQTNDQQQQQQAPPTPNSPGQQNNGGQPKTAEQPNMDID